MSETVCSVQIRKDYPHSDTTVTSLPFLLQKKHLRQSVQDEILEVIKVWSKLNCKVNWREKKIHRDPAGIQTRDLPYISQTLLQLSH